GDLAPIEQHVVGPLDGGGATGAVKALGDGGDGRPGREREQVRRAPDDERGEQGAAGGRAPAPALPPAARGLLAGGDERAVRRAGGRAAPGAGARRGGP